MSHIVMESSLLAEMCHKCIRNIEYLRAWYYAEEMRRLVDKKRKLLFFFDRPQWTYQQAYAYLLESNEGLDDWLITEKYWDVVEIAEKLLSLAHFGDPVTITGDDICVLEFAEMFVLEDYR